MAALTASWHESPPDPLPGEAFSHFQTEHWVRLLRAYGQNPLCVWVHAGDKSAPALASWLLYVTPGDYLNPPRRRAAGAFDVHLRAVHSPVIDPALQGAERERAMAALLEAVAVRVRRLRPISCSLSLDPFMADDDRKSWARLAADAGFHADPSWTYMAHLPGDAEALDAAIKRDRRKSARKAEGEGVEFEAAEGLEALREYYPLRVDTARRNAIAPVPWDHFAATWEALSGSSIYRVFLARHDGRAAAGQLAFTWNGYMYLSGVSVAQWAIDQRLPANDFLQLRLLHWALEDGQLLVDFGGAQPHSQDPKIQAIDNFKRRWGTQLDESVTLTVPGSRTRARAAGLVRRLLG